MAEKDDKIKEAGPGQAVESVTEEVPHPADADSAPGPYDGLEVNRPPVSTNDPQTPIAHSLVAGAGAPSPTETPPEEIPAIAPEGPSEGEAKSSSSKKASS